VTPAERKALLFLSAVGLLGAGARVAADRVPGRDAASTQHALARQLAAVDSAREARRSGKKAAKRPPKRAPRGRAGTTKPSGAAAAGAEFATPIDVDVADSAALDRLPGIGPALAARIVAERSAGGAFGSVSGLERVRGIGPALGKRVAPHVTFSGTPRPTSAAAGSASREAATSHRQRRSGPP
jgi:DNA uptake protein ComE-like DNA-binding protein